MFTQPPLHIVKSCIKAAAFVHFFSTFHVGFYTRQAYIQDRIMCSCTIISSIHSAEHACSNSTSVCSIHDFPYNKHNKKSLLQATATIRERLMCRHAVAKVRLLFKGDFYTRLYGIRNAKQKHVLLRSLKHMNITSEQSETTILPMIRLHTMTSCT